MSALVEVLTAQREHIDVAEANRRVIPHHGATSGVDPDPPRVPAATIARIMKQGKLETHEASGAKHAPAAGDASALHDEYVVARVASSEHRLVASQEDGVIISLKSRSRAHLAGH